MIAASIVASIVASAIGTASASKRDWVGSAACGACHPAELAAWRATPHATTRARFASGTPESRCVACHGTGEAPAGPTIAVEVGCESCHGAGAGYAEDDLMRDRSVALALGLADVSTPKLRAAMCNACHARRVGTTPVDPVATVGVHPIKKATP